MNFYCHSVEIIVPKCNVSSFKCGTKLVIQVHKAIPLRVLSIPAAAFNFYRLPTVSILPWGPGKSPNISIDAIEACK